MTATHIHRTQPNEAHYLAFCNLPKKLYSEEELTNNTFHEYREKHLLCLLVAVRENEIVGRVAVYHNPELNYPEEESKTLCLGAYESIDDELVAMALFDEANTIAKENKYSFILGPIEGSTWYSYRFNVAGEKDRFSMEPLHKEYYPKLFASVPWI